MICNADDTLTIYDKTQSVSNSQLYVTKVFGYSKDEVGIESAFVVGGGFDSALRSQYQLFFATLAAKAAQAFHSCDSYARPDAHYWSPS